MRRTPRASWRSTWLKHEGGNARGEFCFTLTVTDVATGWTENQSVRDKAHVHVFAATHGPWWRTCRSRYAELTPITVRNPSKPSCSGTAKTMT